MLSDRRGAVGRTGPRRLLGRAALAALVLAAGCRGGVDDRGAEGEQAGIEAKVAAQAKRTSLALTEPVRVNAAGSNPVVAAAQRSRDVYLGWVEDTHGDVHSAGSGSEAHGEGSSGRRVVVALSEDGGRSFSNPVAASGEDIDVAAAPVRVALGLEGEVYVLYEREVPHERLKYYSRRPGPAAEDPTAVRRVLRLARSSDGGRSFEAADVGTAAVEGARTSTSLAGLLVVPNGDVFVAWLDFREEFALLALPHDERPDAEYLSLDDSTAPRVEVRVARSTDGGESFGKSIRVGDGASERAPVALVGGAGGALHAVWRERHHWSREAYGTARRDVMVSTSTDDGWLWSPPVRVHDDDFNVSESPGVTSGAAVDSKGRLHVAWYSGARRAAGFYYTTSDNGGKSFAAPVTLLHEEWVPYGDARVVVDGADNAWVVLADHREDTPRFVVARIGPGGRVALSPPRPGATPSLAVAEDGIKVAWVADEDTVAVASPAD